MAFTIAKQDDGTIKYTETLANVADGEVGYSSEFSLMGHDYISVLTDEVTNGTVTLEVLKSGKTVSTGGTLGLDPSAAATDPEVWTAITIDSGAIADNAVDMKMLSNAIKGRFKCAASGGVATAQPIVFYLKGVDSGSGFSIDPVLGVGADPS